MTSWFSGMKLWSFFNSVVFPLLIQVITGSGTMTIFISKGLTRNPKIGNTPVCVLPKLGRVRETKFDTNVSNRMLLNAAKCQGCSFYRF